MKNFITTGGNEGNRGDCARPSFIFPPFTLFASVKSICRYKLAQWTRLCFGPATPSLQHRNTLLSLAIVGVLSTTMLSGVAQAAPADFKTNTIEWKILYGDSRTWSNINWQDFILTNTIVSVTNRFWMLVCEPKYSTPTNIIISTNYTGTIQVGTNYFTVSELMAAKGPIGAQGTNIDWFGYFVDSEMVTNRDIPLIYLEKFGWPQYQVGLRSDGIVVWRKTLK